MIRKRIFGTVLLTIALLVPQAIRANVYNRAQQAMDQYIAGSYIDQEIGYKDLKIFTLKNSSCAKRHPEKYLTLDESTDKKLLRIKEASQYGNVNTVKMKNKGSKPIFIMKGEIIVGAKQDRMASRDIIIPANNKWIKVPVFCVEHGRWHHTTSEFSSGKLCVPNSLRKRATETNNQGEVWDEISNLQLECGVKSGTQTVVANYQDKKINRKLEKYMKYFANIPERFPSTVGVVVCTGDRIIAIDSFENNRLFKKLWPKLLKSYAMDAINGSRSTVERQDVLDLADTIVQQKPLANNCSLAPNNPSQENLGNFFTCSCAAGTGSVLVKEKEVIFWLEVHPPIPEPRIEIEIVHCSFFTHHENKKHKKRGLGIRHWPSRRCPGLIINEPHDPLDPQYQE